MIYAFIRGILQISPHLLRSFYFQRCEQITLRMYMNKIDHSQSRQREGSNNVSASIFDCPGSTRCSLSKRGLCCEKHTKRYHSASSTERHASPPATRGVSPFKTKKTEFKQFPFGNGDLRIKTLTAIDLCYLHILFSVGVPS